VRQSNCAWMAYVACIGVDGKSGVRCERDRGGSDSRTSAMGDHVLSSRSRCRFVRHQDSASRIVGGSCHGSIVGPRRADDTCALPAPLSSRWNRPRTAVRLLGSASVTRKARGGNRQLSRWDLCPTHRHQGATRLEGVAGDPDAAGCMSDADV